MSRDDLALFDFDGTITSQDSLILFIRYAKGNLATALGILLLAPMLIAFKCKLIPNYKTKQWLFTYFFKGMSEAIFNQKAAEFSLKQLETILRPEAIKKINWHKAQGHKIIVISASIENWLKPWCDQNQLALIATTLEIKNGHLSGKFQSKNCYGIEKVNRLKHSYDLNKFKTIYAYGDSRGDRELLEIAHHKFYRRF